MVGEKVVSLMLRAGKEATPNSEKTDLIYGKVVSTQPLKIQVANEPKLVLTETFLVLSELCKEKTIQIPQSTTTESAEHVHDTKPISITLWTGLQVGDSVVMLRVLKGSKFLVLQKEGN